MMEKICVECITIEELRSLITSVINDALSTLKSSPEDDIITREGAIKILDISYPTLNTWVKEGRINVYPHGGRRYFKKSELLPRLEALSSMKHKKYFRTNKKT